MNFTILPKSWSPALLTALRIVVGLMFLEHGTGKILGFPAMSAGGGMPHGLFLFTGWMELIPPLFILAGFFTRPVAFLLSGYCAFAYFLVHAKMGFFPVLNHGEPAILFCFAFLYLAAAGPGLWAVDNGRRAEAGGIDSQAAARA